jgi:hypothetical protein
MNASTPGNAELDRVERSDESPRRQHRGDDGDDDSQKTEPEDLHPRGVNVRHALGKRGKHDEATGLVGEVAAANESRVSTLAEGALGGDGRCGTHARIHPELDNSRRPTRLTEE